MAKKSQVGDAQPVVDDIDLNPTVPLGEEEAHIFYSSPLQSLFDKHNQEKKK